MRVKLEAYGVAIDVEGTLQECQAALSVWYLVAVMEGRAKHGDKEGAAQVVVEAMRGALEMAKAKSNIH